VLEQPSCLCLQHQAILLADQPRSHLDSPAWQSYGSDEVIASHPTCSCSQHHEILYCDHPLVHIASASWQSNVTTSG